jgi:hypothetical protein
VEVVDEAKEECVDCGIASNPAELLLCDGCDSLHHVHCVGLSAVPARDWFCRDCTAILQARAAHMATANAVTTSTKNLLPQLAAIRKPLELDGFANNLRDILYHRQTLELQGLKIFMPRPKRPGRLASGNSKLQSPGSRIASR